MPLLQGSGSAMCAPLSTQISYINAKSVQQLGLKRSSKRKIQKLCLQPSRENKNLLRSKREKQKLLLKGLSVPKNSALLLRCKPRPMNKRE